MMLQLRPSDSSAGGALQLLFHETVSMNLEILECMHTLVFVSLFFAPRKQPKREGK